MSSAYCFYFCLDLVYCSMGLILLNFASTFILVLIPQKVAEVSYRYWMLVLVASSFPVIFNITPHQIV